MKGKTAGFYMTIVAALLSVVGAILYGSVMYKLNMVYGFLIAAIVLGVLAFLLGKTSVVNLIPVVNAVLMASAGVWAASLMVNQIGYVVAGLDGFNTIQSFVIFEVVAVLAMLLNIIASFLPMKKN
ncbi:MAG: hypothetical protein HUJ72_12520 [Blautia sp.]|nr:hypothetical protein [Blautia sp.]